MPGQTDHTAPTGLRKRTGPTRRHVTDADRLAWPNIDGEHRYTASDVERFLAKVDMREPGECWPWTGNTVSHRPSLPLGYGQMYGNPTQISAHRMSYALANPGGLGDMFGCHSCDNSICCNPAHIFPGTHLENMADMRAKGRRPHVRPRRLTEEESRNIADRAAAGVKIAVIAREAGIHWETARKHAKESAHAV